MRKADTKTARNDNAELCAQAFLFFVVQRQARAAYQRQLTYRHFGVEHMKVENVHAIGGPIDQSWEMRFEELNQLARRYAKARAQKEHLEEFKKSKLAILMKKHERDGHKTNAAQEREARADDDYIALLEGLQAATEEAEALRWELELVKLRFETWRTKESTKRAEMGMR